MSNQKKHRASSPDYRFDGSPGFAGAGFSDQFEQSAFTNDIEFDTSFRGYNRDQVNDYLDKLTIDYNAICEKCATLEDVNDRLHTALSELSRLFEKSRSII